ncbi:threonine synthase [Paenibacillus albiflavus]|uniref:Threonine synthase n=1 Tax=Paenibacillus albiflavus TaxID=2545760 RepID=A0A4R4EP44_9BACL|nr:threonine synthase [Paenibacillus albiflavus]TCZ80148.1 threonine synthase [Paenibacillus albiflavus]
MRIQCVDCGEQMKDWAVRCQCGGILEIKRDLSSLDRDYLLKLFNERLYERGTLYASGVWRYRELIAPELPQDILITRGEGNTGLYSSKSAADYAGIRQLQFKAQSENPSGSFKDNGMVVAVSHGLSLGKHRFACSSTGNTSASLSLYAAWSGTSSYIFAPAEHISAAKISQTAAYGGHLVRFHGTYDDGIHFLEQYADALDLYVCNSLNPYRIEGQKSIIFELAQQLNWSMPDWIAIPGGALSNVSALGKGLEDLFTLGLINKLPRIALIQAEGASPFHRMMQSNDTSLLPDSNPFTRASAMNIGNPPSWKKARHAIQLTNGITASVTDEEIMQAKQIIDRNGIGCEPASAATLAGIKKLRAIGVIDKDEHAVCILTGHLLKDIAALDELYSHDQTSQQAVELTQEQVSIKCY